ncbi:MAG TPA: FAD-linked oxidase C-terminal domain-containing protein [Thermodesulfobacteriota bacterium]|nr:FAD-linked oxidase C-terminal domain-containing protein [Thermodesulfobacteriota bacterium]
MISREILKELEEIVGTENLLTSRASLLCYSYDATGQSYIPEAVALPANTVEVSRIVRLANKFKFPIVPRGAGSGFAGGSVPLRNGVVIHLSRLNKILEIDAENLTAVVEPCVVTGVFQDEVERLGLFYPPDPASLKFSTMGGNASTGAGGPRAVKYGVTRDYILGLEVVTPTGEIIRTGGKTVKRATGYDLTRLMIGSEGTLGIITKLIIKLIPLPEAKKTMTAVFRSAEDAARSVSDIIRSKIVPTTLELLDKNTLACVKGNLGIPLPEETSAMLLIEIDGDASILEKQAGKIKEMCRKNNALEFNMAANKEEADALWKARRGASPSMLKFWPGKISEDIVVPRSRIPEMIRRLDVIADRHNLVIASFGHAGDGNLHVNIKVDKKSAEDMKRVEEAIKDIFRATVELEGAISGEHGIGISKAPYLKMQLSDAEIEMMKAIKKALDPNNILNPGKIFQEAR